LVRQVAETLKFKNSTDLNRLVLCWLALLWLKSTKSALEHFDQSWSEINLSRQTDAIITSSTRIMMLILVYLLAEAFGYAALRQLSYCVFIIFEYGLFDRITLLVFYMHPTLTVYFSLSCPAP
jgi:hypothetical protein